MSSTPRELTHSVPQDRQTAAQGDAVTCRLYRLFFRLLRRLVI